MAVGDRREKKKDKMEIKLVNKEEKKGWREGREMEKKELKYIMYSCKFPTMNMIIMHT